MKNRLLISRGVILLIAIGMRFIPKLSPFDASSEMAHRVLLDKSLSATDRYILEYLGVLSHWDGQYFLQIAQFGYEHEKVYAFFPALPLILQSAVQFIRSKVICGLHFRSAAILVSILWNGFLCSYLSAMFLYHLTLRMYGTSSMAMLSAKLFLFNPASIFFVAVYSESTFSTLSFLLMLCCDLKYFEFNTDLSRHSMALYFVMMCCIAAASTVRSNGIILIGFPLYFHLYSNWFCRYDAINVLAAIRSISLSALNPFGSSSGGPLQWADSTVSKLRSIEGAILETLSFVRLLCILMMAISPWIYYHYFCRIALCDGVLNGERAYCSAPILSLSTAYSFIQRQYWNCGLLLRWNSNEIGNFLLATPIWYILHF